LQGAGCPIIWTTPYFTPWTVPSFPAFEPNFDVNSLIHRCTKTRSGHIGALAHLGLSRAYVLQGDSANAKAAYQDFLTLWKDADPDIPILTAAQSEYAKLK
jgi:hypothetical protein